MKFEESIKQLDEILEKLEGGKIPLDESVDLYSKGMKLCVECAEKLNEVKGKLHCSKKVNKDLSLKSLR